MSIKKVLFLLILLILPATPALSDDPTPTPDANPWILYHSTDGQIYRVRLDGSDRQPLTQLLDEDWLWIAPLPPVGDWIYFTVADGTLYRVRDDGSGLTALRHSGEASFLTWSPDGEWMYLTSGNDLARMKSDGTGYEILLEEINVYSMHDWSQGWLYFSAFTENQSLSIFRMQADGSELQDLTPGWDAYFLAQSPNGEFIYFYLPGEALARIRSDGTGLIHIPTGFGTDFVVGWSPDGQWLHLDGRQGYRYCDMYRVKWDGSISESLTGHMQGQSWFVDWSPDGQWILFHSDQGGLYLMRTDDPDQRQLTYNGEMSGTWSPDGQWIFYISGYASGDIYRIRPDGSDQQRLTTVPGYKEFLRWVEGGVLFVNDYSNLYWVGPDSETERLLVPDMATDGIYTFLAIR